MRLNKSNFKRKSALGLVAALMVVVLSDSIRADVVYWQLLVGITALLVWFVFDPYTLAADLAFIFSWAAW